MKSIALKLVLVVFLIGVIQSSSTSAYFVDAETSVGNTMTAGCWSNPEVPTQIYPFSGYLADSVSDWYHNPHIDWSDSWVCLGKTVKYQYESYNDSNLNILAYRSALLNESRIDNPGTPNGSYYWRIRAFDGENWSNWSPVWLLTVDSTLPLILPLQRITPIEEPIIIETEEKLNDVITLPEITIEPDIEVLVEPIPEFIPEPIIEQTPEELFLVTSKPDLVVIIEEPITITEDVTEPSLPAPIELEPNLVIKDEIDP